MDQSQLSRLMRRLNRMLDGREAGGLNDADLLERFAVRRDEAAFEALVWRHGPMVHGLCRRLLRRAEDADDAFQATFLILVRKARSISKLASLSSWLYKVAYRVALEARAREAKHAATSWDAELVAEDATDEPARRDLQRVVAEEVDRLPEKYRGPVVLCYLSGKSTEEAAQSLGCPRGTVLSRLAAARQRLHGRLLRRGLAPVAAAAAAALEQKARAAVPEILVKLTVRTAAWLTAGEVTGAGVASGAVLSLMQGAMKAMLVKKLKWAAAVLLTAALVGGGVGIWFRQPAAAESPNRTREAEPAARPEEPRAAAARTEETNRPLGTWEKEVGPYHFTLRIEADRLYATYVGADKEKKFNIALDADYSVTKDNVLYGVITGTDLEGDDFAKESRELAQLPDQPFSFRYRVDGNVLTVKVLYLGLEFEKGDKAQADGTIMLLGRWKKKTEPGREAAR